MDAPRRLKTISALVAIITIVFLSLVYNDRALEMRVGRLGSSTLKTFRTRLSPAKRANITATRAIEQDFPDPSIIKFGDSWYAFATTNGKGINVQLAVSPDFSTWSVVQGYDALPQTGNWSDPGPVVWAPDININDYGQFILYYAARMKGETSYCVSAGYSWSPTGPFVPLDDPIACNTKKGGSIDPSGFRDDDGERYLLYKVDGNHIGNGGSCNNGNKPIKSTPIMLQLMWPDGVTPQGPPVKILDRSDRDGPLIEAPSMTRTHDGKYVMFFSSNCFTSEHYDISYAFADKIKGPYKKYGPLAKTGMMGLQSPGGADVSADGEHLVFHANSPDGTGRNMYTAYINIDSKTHTIS
ncbi:glycosyl hydrolase [Phyllosticta citrichinensis]